MSNNSESTFAFQKISVLSQHFSSSWGLTKPPGVWRGSYGWCSSVGNHLSTLCGLLREICCPGKSFLWMAIWLLKWSWAFLCLSAYGSRALLGVEQLDISRWGWSFLLAAPSPHRVTWSPAVCWWALRGCGSVSGVPDRLSQGSDLRVSSPTLRSCMTVCHGYGHNHSCLDHTARGQTIPLLPEKDVRSPRWAVPETQWLPCRAWGPWSGRPSSAEKKCLSCWIRHRRAWISALTLSTCVTLNGSLLWVPVSCSVK